MVPQVIIFAPFEQPRWFACASTMCAAAQYHSANGGPARRPGQRGTLFQNATSLSALVTKPMNGVPRGNGLRPADCRNGHLFMGHCDRKCLFCRSGAGFFSLAKVSVSEAALLSTTRGCPPRMAFLLRPRVFFPVAMLFVMAIGDTPLSDPQAISSTAVPLSPEKKKKRFVCGCLLCHVDRSPASPLPPSCKLRPL